MKASYGDLEIAPGFSISIRFKLIPANPDLVRITARGARRERCGKGIEDRQFGLFVDRL
jgi:hypothetical protein